MDVKATLNSIIPLQLRSKDGVQKAIRPDSATDRDGNGQQSLHQDQKQREPMTPEELEKAKEHLLGLAVVKENNLLVEFKDVGLKKVIILSEPDGKVIRRITEDELWTLQSMQDEAHEKTSKGQILNKSA